MAQFENIKNLLEQSVKLRKTIPTSNTPLHKINKEGLSETQINDLFERIISESTQHSLRMMGHMDTQPFDEAVVADAIVSKLNNNVLFYELSPIATRIEMYMIDYFCQKLSMSDGFGIFCSGGSIANITGLFAAAGGFQNQQTRSDIEMFVSEAAHISIKKAATLIGIDNVTVIHALASGKIDIEQLEQAVKNSDVKTKIIIGTVGTTIQGAYDDIPSMIKIAEHYGCWVHVDAIYGGATIFSETHKHCMDGVQYADSVSLGHQKWMGVPRVSGICILKDKKQMDQRLAMDVPYSVGDQMNLGTWGIQGSRRADAITLWITLCAKGEKFIENWVDTAIEKTHTFYKMLSEDENFEPVHQPEMNLQLFRPKKQVDMLTAHKQLTDKGQEWVSLSTWKQEPVYRAVILHPDTQIENLSNVLDLLKQ
ncbi:MAG: aspartate aminotransferase family protein [Deltaproteobacteria bacterium]|nr:aspartate aminotransferase family protein [Deltaproteobacteria bacterium]